MIPPQPIGLFSTRSENSKLKTFNYRVEQEVNQTTMIPVLQDKFFQMPDDIRPQNNIGINTNPMMMSLGCRSVQEINGRVKMGIDSKFNGSDYNISPQSWKSPLSYVPERQGLSHNFKQPPLSINTWY